MKHIRHILFMLVLPGALASCTLETSDNGTLDGFWQMTTVDTLATGGKADLTSTGLTWSFQGRLMELREATMEYESTDILCRFERNQNKLTVSNPVHNDRAHDDPAVSDIDGLRPFGINRFDEQFTIATLTRSRMVLETEDLRLSFRKY